MLKGKISKEDSCTPPPPILIEYFYGKGSPLFLRQHQMTSTPQNLIKNIMEGEGGLLLGRWCNEGGLLLHFDPLLAVRRAPPHAGRTWELLCGGSYGRRDSALVVDKGGFVISH